MTEFRPLDDVVEEHIQAAIKAADGKLTVAADLLKVGRSTLYRRVKTGTQAHLPRPMRSPRGDGLHSAKREIEVLRARIAKLQETTEAAAEDQTTAYTLGVANGLILARHIMEARAGSPAYL